MANDRDAGEADGPGDGRSASQPHDGLFRFVFSDPVNAASELRSVLPPALAAEIDWERLDSVPGTFVDPALRQLHTDVLFSTTWRGRDAYVYVLIEHQSSVDTWMALRMLGYLVRIWERHREQQPQAHRLPFIVSLVVHQGPGRWTAANNLLDLVDVPETVGLSTSADQADWLPRFRYLVDDLGSVDVEALRRRPLTESAAVTLVLLRAARGDVDLVHTLRGWVHELRTIVGNAAGRAVFDAMVTYVLNNGEVAEQDLIDLAAQIGPQAEEVAVTTAEKLRLEGEARGEARGRAAMLADQLAMKFGQLSDDDRRRITAATPEQISTWSARLIGGAATLDQVLGTD